MVFHSKVDAFFITLISISVLIIAAATLLPAFIDEKATTPTIIIMFTIFIISVGIIGWSVFFIKYVFYEEYLLVKGGPFRSKIPYQTIKKVSPTNHMLTGYRIASSKHGIELFYKSAILGSVKISPNDKKAFIIELEERCHYDK